MRSKGQTRALALLTVFAIACSDMTTSPLPLASRSKPVYVEIAGTWLAPDSIGFTAIITDVTTPDTVAVSIFKAGLLVTKFSAVRNGGDRKDAVWSGIAFTGNLPPMLVDMTLVKGHYKPATHMVMTLTFHNYVAERWDFVRVKHTP
jgi:hypothetical protein